MLTIWPTGCMAWTRSVHWAVSGGIFLLLVPGCSITKGYLGFGSRHKTGVPIPFSGGHCCLWGLQESGLGRGEKDWMPPHCLTLTLQPCWEAASPGLSTEGPDVPVVCPVGMELSSCFSQAGKPHVALPFWVGQLSWSWNR